MTIHFSQLERFDLRDLELIDNLGEGFLERYVVYASASTDAPVEYHLGCGFGLMSSIVGRKAYEPLMKSYPNLWILLVGPTTIFRKTTSLRIASRLLRKAAPDSIIASDFSPQSLLGAIAERQGQPAVLFRDETSGFFRAISRQAYMAGMSETLIKVFDGDPCSRKLRKEEIIVEEPYLVWFGGSVTEKLLDAIGEQEIFSGLMVRFILIQPTEKGSFKPLVYGSAEEEWREEDLLFRLERMERRLRTAWSLGVGSTLVAGEAPHYFVLNPCALDRLNAYVRVLEEESFGDPLVEKINSRTGPLAIKLATLLACDHWNSCVRNLNTVFIGEDILVKALYFAELFRTHAVRVLGGVGDTTRERRYGRLIKFIKVHPGVKRGKLMRRFKLTAREMDEFKQTAMERGLIKIAARRSSPKGRAAEVYFVRTEEQV